MPEPSSNSCHVADLRCEQAVTQSLPGPPGDTVPTGHRMAEPLSLLTGSAGAFPEAARALPCHLHSLLSLPHPLCPAWDLQPGRHSSTHNPTQPIGSSVVPFWVSVRLLRTTNWTQTFPLKPLNTSRLPLAATQFTGGRKSQTPLGAEDSPHYKPVLLPASSCLQTSRPPGSHRGRHADNLSGRQHGKNSSRRSLTWPCSTQRSL